MKKLLYSLALGALLAGMSFADGVTTSGGGFTVTAAEGDSHCVFTAPHLGDSGTITCYRGRVEEYFAHWHASLGTSVSGSFNDPLHTISWVLEHTGPGDGLVGSYTWKISLDGGPPIIGTF